MLGLIGLLLALITIRELDCISPVRPVSNSNVLQVAAAPGLDAYATQRQPGSWVQSWFGCLAGCMEKREILLTTGGGKRHRSACTQPLADLCSR